MVDKVKKKFPGEFVRVNVDSTKLSLNVARRGSKDTNWSYLRDDIFLPKDVLNIGTRKVPQDFVLRNLPESISDYTPNKPDRGRNSSRASNMEVLQQNE